MKSIFTLIMVLSGLHLFGQIQLDSIVQIDPLTNELYEKLSFEYQDGELSKYVEQFDIYKTEVDIMYKANGDYDQWFVDNDGDDGVFQFIYDVNDRLDSVSISYQGQASTVLDYTYVNDVLQSIESSNVDYGISEPYLRRDFDFTDDVLNAYTDYDISDGTDQLETDYSLFYDTDGRLVKQVHLDEDGIYRVDSLSYDLDGNIKDLYRLDYDGSELEEITQLEAYSSDATIKFDDIISPVNFLGFISEFGNSAYNDSYFPMKYGNKVNLSITNDYYYDESQTAWYYSGIVGINERVPTLPISVYPNPTSDHIRIEKDEILTQYYIYDSRGSLVSEGLPNLSNSINVSQLPNGSYTIICSDKAKKHYFAQFLKQ